MDGNCNGLQFAHYDLRMLRHRYREFSSLSEGSVHSEFKLALRQLAKSGLRVLIAEDKGRIVGSIGYMPTPDWKGFHTQPGFFEAVEAEGVDTKAVQVRTLIYVHPDYQGQGLASRMEAEVDTLSLELGFTHVAGFGYDAEDAYLWLSRRNNTLDLGVQDHTGLPCILIPIISQ